MTIRGCFPVQAGDARWWRLARRAEGGEGLCRRSSFLGKQPATLQAPQAVMRPGSPLWPLDTLVCAEEAAGVSVQQNTRSAEDAETGPRQRQHGRSSRASSGLPGGRRCGPEARRRAREGAAPPGDRRAVLASGDPGKAPDRIHRRPREVLSTSTPLGAPVFVSGCLVAAHLSPACSYLLLCLRPKSIWAPRSRRQ